MAGGTDMAFSAPLQARTARLIGAAKPRGVQSRAEARAERVVTREPRLRLRIEFTIVVVHVKGFRMATPVGW